MDIPVGLSSEQNVGSHCGRLAAIKDQTYQKPRIHEGLVGGSKTDNGKSESRDHEKALNLNKDVMLPFCIVVQKDLGI